MKSNILKVLLFSVLPLFFINANDKETKVLVGEIKSNIDPRTNRYTKLLLEEASEKNYDIIIIEMDTYGGAVNDADDIRTRILDFEKPIYVWINKDAASAGALISIATDSIYMSSGASIGAATVVTGDGTQAPDKYQSYMRSIMRSTAEAKGRDPKIAEAMVDEDIEVDSISAEGKVITFSTQEAIKFGFCDAELNSIEEILERQNINNYNITKYELGSTEDIISFFLNPVVSSVLILLILGGLYFEMQTPGVGFPIVASITALVLYLVPYYLNGVASTLFSDIKPIVKGSEESETVDFYFAYTLYELKQFDKSAKYFKGFIELFSRSEKVVEAEYLYAISLYKTSPNSNLDQSSTVEAISAVQNFINKYPYSEYSIDANNIIDELQVKLETKNFENAKQYYKTRNYKSCVFFQ